MKGLTMNTQIRPAICLFAVLTAITGLLYPALVTGIVQTVFPYQAKGSLIEQGGKRVGSELIGQNFSDPGHFWGRPSATAPQPYNAAASSGSNLGPLNPALIDAAKARAAALHAADPGNRQPIPIELLTASASGLDPHISPAAALWQAPRIARVRKLPEEQVRSLVAQYTEGRDWGFFGQPRVNVLKLNLALDNATTKSR